MKRTSTLLIISIFLASSVAAQRAALPYFYDFESGMNGWISSDDGLCGTSWELGTPTFGWTIGAYSGDYCMDVNLNTGYTNNSICYLISPVFDFSFVNRATISFWTKYKTEYLWDYLSVQYTVDKGDHWSYLPFPYLVNPDGYVEKWIKSELEVTNLYGYPDVQFRLVFSSDGSILFDGYSVDDFSIEVDPLGIPASTQDESFTVYPNPSMGNVSIKFSTEVSGARIDVYDATGKVVLSKEADEALQGNIQCSAMQKGTYSVVYRDQKHFQVKKLVVID